MSIGTPPRIDRAVGSQGHPTHPAPTRVGVRPGRADALVARLGEGRWRVTAVAAVAVVLGAACMQPLLDGGWWFPRTVLAVAVVAVVGGVARTLRMPALRRNGIEDAAAGPHDPAT